MGGWKGEGVGSRAVFVLSILPWENFALLVNSTSMFKCQKSLGVCVGSRAVFVLFRFALLVNSTSMFKVIKRA